MLPQKANGCHQKDAAGAVNKAKPPQGEYIEAQQEIARGEYRDAMNHLNQMDQELDDVTYSTGR